MPTGSSYLTIRVAGITLRHALSILEVVQAVWSAIIKANTSKAIHIVKTFFIYEGDKYSVFA